jgi:O-antigen/teichoic acid export membrane protein
MKFGKQFLSGVFWSTAGTFAVQGGTFIASLLVANFVGVASFGKYSFVISTTQMIAATLQLATGSVTTKFLAEYRHANKERASLVLGLCQRITLIGGGLGTLAMLLLATGVANQLLNTTALNWYFVLSAPAVLFTLLTSFHLAGIAGVQEFRRSATLLTILTIILISTCAFAAWDFGITGALVAITLNLGLRAVATHKILMNAIKRDDIHPKFKIDQFSRNVFVQYIIPGSLSGFTAAPALWFASATLTQVPDSFEQLAFLNSALVIRNAFIIIPSIIGGVSLAMLSATLRSSSKQGYISVLGLSIGLTATIAILSVAVINFFGHQLLSFYGHNFSDALPILRVLSISLLLEAACLPLQQALISKGVIWRTFIFAQLPRDLIVAIFSYLFVVDYAAIGVAYAHALGWSISLIVSIILTLGSKIHLAEAESHRTTI